MNEISLVMSPNFSILTLGLLLYCHFFKLICASNCVTDFNNEGTCAIKDTISNKYVLYDVSPHEGFNLRRDVYMRLAVFIRNLNRRDSTTKWHLVLPPWNNMPHWRSKDVGLQSYLPWSLFFNLQSLKNFAEVMEMYEFFENFEKVTIDQVIILQHFKEMFSDNFNWEDKWLVEECQKPIELKLKNDDYYQWPVLGYRNISVKNINCISYHGSASFLEQVLNSFQGRVFLIEHAEIVLHDYYGGKDYWNCRRSMKFNEDLYEIAFEFRKSQLGGTTGIRNEPFTNENETYFKGDPFLCAHLRRRDYIHSRPSDTPSLEWATVQILKKLKEYNLSTVLIISDAINKDMLKTFEEMLPYRVVAHFPTDEVRKKYKDGGVAIIDQIICSYARYFIGSYESTFSLRIQEERELLNFHPDTTFNRFCGDSQTKCTQPSRWRKV